MVGSCTHIVPPPSGGLRGRAVVVVVGMWLVPPLWLRGHVGILHFLIVRRLHL